MMPVGIKGIWTFGKFFNSLKNSSIQLLEKWTITKSYDAVSIDFGNIGDIMGFSNINNCVSVSLWYLDN
ncbi:hypothetical protein NG798_04435 [Ancylothrix sp. C2]|uniref:hypothetical protein n=1 Tax=Ancylothrix sp. D3o TaxID=2953691 RepID=UPI0021BADF0D|nr:hypothetical protein [Ancylothrix sp. D3o]MCT7949026.1 hypothetical protein [Ancylothrix sp. D3o]